MKYSSLEHQILKILYEKTNLVITKSEDTPLYQRRYASIQFHFGFIVDILNNPQKYKDSDIMQTELSSISPKENQIGLWTYGFMEVADAVEVLIDNDHVTESFGSFMHGEITTRKIQATRKGILAYRQKYYIKQAAQELFVERSYTIQRTEFITKKFWYLWPIIAFLIGYFGDVSKDWVKKKIFKEEQVQSTQRTINDNQPKAETK